MGKRDHDGEYHHERQRKKKYVGNPSKFDKIWDNISEEKRSNIQMDSLSMYSVTQGSLADEMTEVILSIAPGATTITDGTACVGGNTISFARRFSKVNAVEMDQQRYLKLKHNIRVFDFKNVEVIHGNFLEIFPKLEQDVIFLDPPWGGPKFVESPSIHLWMGIKPFSLIVSEIAPCCSFVCIKIPYNLDIPAFVSASGLELLKSFHYWKMSLLILKGKKVTGTSTSLSSSYGDDHVGEIVINDFRGTSNSLIDAPMKQKIINWITLLWDNYYPALRGSDNRWLIDAFAGSGELSQLFAEGGMFQACTSNAPPPEGAPFSVVGFEKDPGLYEKLCSTSTTLKSSLSLSLKKPIFYTQNQDFIDYLYTETLNRVSYTPESLYEKHSIVFIDCVDIVKRKILIPIISQSTETIVDYEFVKSRKTLTHIIGRHVLNNVEVDHRVRIPMLVICVPVEMDLRRVIGIQFNSIRIISHVFNMNDDSLNDTERTSKIKFKFKLVAFLSKPHPKEILSKDACGLAIPSRNLDYNSSNTLFRSLLWLKESSCSLKELLRYLFQNHFGVSASVLNSFLGAVTESRERGHNNNNNNNNNVRVSRLDKLVENHTDDDILNKLITHCNLKDKWTDIKSLSHMSLFHHMIHSPMYEYPSSGGSWLSTNNNNNNNMKNNIQATLQASINRTIESDDSEHASSRSRNIAIIGQSNAIKDILSTIVRAEEENDSTMITEFSMDDVLKFLIDSRNGISTHETLQFDLIIVSFGLQYSISKADCKINNLELMSMFINAVVHSSHGKVIVLDYYLKHNTNQFHHSVLHSEEIINLQVSNKVHNNIMKYISNSTTSTSSFNLQLHKDFQLSCHENIVFQLESICDLALVSTSIYPSKVRSSLYKPAKIMLLEFRKSGSGYGS